MPSINSILQDRSIRHAVFLEQLKVSEVRRMVSFLNTKVYPDLVAKIERRLANIATRGFDTGPYTTKRLIELKETIDSVLKSGVGGATKDFMGRLKELAIMEGDFQTRMFKEVVGPFGVEFNKPNYRILQSVVTNRPAQGKLIAEHFRNLGTTASLRVNEQIGIGLVQGESTEKIIRRIRGTVASRFQDGVTGQVNRAASTLVRTSVNHVSTQAREATYEENSDLIKEVRFVAVLDARTTEICASLDGKTFPVGEGERPPLHHQCRSTTVPITKSWKELGIPLKDAPEGTRSALNGQVPAKTTYGEWLKGQPADIQDHVLGKGRADLFRGGLPIERFVDPQNNPISLSRLQQLEGTGEFAPIPSDPVVLQREIDALLDQLGKSTDPGEKKRLRAALRKRGHTGGSKVDKPIPKPQVTRTPTPPPESIPQPPSELRGPGVLRSGKEIRREAEAILAEVSDEAQVKLQNRIETIRAELRELLVKETAERERIAKELDITFIYDRRVNDVIDKHPVVKRATELRSEISGLLDRQQKAIASVNERIARLIELNPEDRGLTVSYQIAGTISRNTQKSVDEAKEWLEKVVSPRALGGEKTAKMTVRVSQLDSHEMNRRGEGRAFHKSGTIRLDKTYVPQVAVHEIGHAFEFASPAWKRRAQAFLRDRVSGEQIEFLREMTKSKQYGIGEKAWRDKFFDPYVGRYYVGGSTEITSMGFEALFKNPRMLLEQDPEMFEFLLNVARGL